MSPPLREDHYLFCNPPARVAQNGKGVVGPVRVDDDSSKAN